MGGRKGEGHHDTPKRAKVRGVIEFLEHHNLLGQKKGQVNKQQVFDFFGVSGTQGHIIIKSRIEETQMEPIPFDPNGLGSDPDARTAKNDPRFKRHTRSDSKKFRDEQQAQRRAGSSSGPSSTSSPEDEDASPTNLILESPSPMQ